jgi:hypothetical protein
MTATVMVSLLIAMLCLWRLFRHLPARFLSGDSVVVKDLGSRQAAVNRAIHPSVGSE